MSSGCYADSHTNLSRRLLAWYCMIYRKFCAPQCLYHTYRKEKKKKKKKSTSQIACESVKNYARKCVVVAHLVLHLSFFKSVPPGKVARQHWGG